MNGFGSFTQEAEMNVGQQCKWSWEEVNWQITQCQGAGQARGPARMFQCVLKAPSSLGSWQPQLHSIPNACVTFFLFLFLKQGLCCIFFCSSVQFSCSVVSDSLQPHRLQHARLPCPSQTPRTCSNSCPLFIYFYLFIYMAALDLTCDTSDLPLWHMDSLAVPNLEWASFF